ncbi:MAG: DUF3298 domain-containing protein [Stenotrophomonas sp.]|nr:DUF3298 domain-containing protein [Stenotrophomonas sp.]
MKSLRRNLPVAAVLGMAIAAVLLAGCGRQEGSGADSRPAPAGDAAGQLPAPVAEAPADAPVALADVIETSPQAVVGISYAAGLDQYQGLAKALQEYAAAARGELQQAIDGLGNDKPTMPYELSLAFEKQLETPELVVVRAEGSRYTGGAHGEPLVARFVWLPGSQQMLTADHLVPDAKGWKAISDFVADQLRERVATRLSSEDMEPGELQESLRSASRMINEGTGARPDNFRQFEPMTDAAGKVTGLRFVFPPYQVGPYSEGTQTAEVPASVLAPHVAPEYAGLFAHG